MKELLRILSALWLASASVCLGSPEVADFWGSYDAREAPLNVEGIRAWETEEGVFQLVRYDLGRLTGSNQSASPKIAAYYGRPKGAEKVPGIVHIHGGGQRAHQGRVEDWVKLGYARDPRIRFWRSAEVKQAGNVYSGNCPVFDINEPLFAFANITYRMDRTLPARPGAAATDRLTVSSDYQIATPDALQAAGVKSTEQPRRGIDDFAQGWQDGYRLSAENPHHWFYATRKIVDPSWIGPKGGKLAFDMVTTEADNRLAVGVEVNTWQGYTGRKKDTFHAVVPLPAAGSNAVTLSAGDFLNAAGESLADWDEATELTFTPAKRISTAKEADAEWQGRPPALQRLRWEGGTQVPRPHPHQPRGEASLQGRLSFEEEFQSAIEDSVELEERDAQQVR